ncbi:MAG: RNase adapter RapZ [Eubacterium sp.]|jgi:UPF0042 nucleotide-binding protein
MTADKPMEVVLITGLSGAGKTQAADWFEDQGWYCIDNMPPLLIRNFLDLAQMSGKQKIRKAAFVVDIRSEQFFQDLNGAVHHLTERQDVNLRLLFLEASDDTLIRRFSETRRTHPLAQGMTTAQAIAKERAMLEPFRGHADVIIDTSSLKVSQFQHLMQRSFGSGEEVQSQFALSIASFGFKYGLPPDADLIFDVRFIPNPYYVKSLRKLTGNNRKVRDYVMRQEITGKFLDSVEEMLTMLIPCYIKEGKYHLNIYFGCTGGQHRSVVVANAAADFFHKQGYHVFVHHREMQK